VAELIVTEPLPVELNVTVWVVAVPTETFPKARLDEPTLNAGVAPFNCSANVRGVPPMFADSVAVCELVTDETVAEKLALLAPAATATVDGTVTAVLLLDRLIAYPPLAAGALIATVHVSVPDPV